MQYERSHVLPQIAGTQASQWRKTEAITIIWLSKGVPFDNISPTTSSYFTIRKATLIYIENQRNGLVVQTISLYNKECRRLSKGTIFDYSSNNTKRRKDMNYVLQELRKRNSERH